MQINTRNKKKKKKIKATTNLKCYRTFQNSLLRGVGNLAICTFFVKTQFVELLFLLSGYNQSLTKRFSRNKRKISNASGEVII